MTEQHSYQLTAELIDDALAELITIHDWLRFAVSQFNAADIYFGHGTDNPWDEAGVLMAHTLHFTHLAEPALLQTRLLVPSVGSLSNYCKPGLNNEFLRPI